MNNLRGLRIGLVFPELSEHGVKEFGPLLKRCGGQLDLVVFPEGFESIQGAGGTRPVDIAGAVAMLDLREMYFALARVWGASIIVGVSVDYGNRSIGKGGNDQYALFVSSSGQWALYHKHSTSRFTAFFDDGWSIEANLPVVDVNGVGVGLSICHDSYVSLIPRVLKAKGAQVWVNISFQNVRPRIWEAVLQARASENEMFAVCTLHRNSRPKPGEGRPQKEPYAFCPSGKIRLKDLETNAWLGGMPEGSGAGKVFYFDTSDYSVSPPSVPKTRDPPEGADVISIAPDDTGVLQTAPAGDNFVIREIDLQTFLRLPERIWKETLQVRGSVPLFVVRVCSNEQWDCLSPRVLAVVRARVIEFSTLFLFLGPHDARIFLGAYQSSNYKDARVFYPQGFPVKVDRRYLRGLESTWSISLRHRRGKESSIYFERVGKLIAFLDTLLPGGGNPK